MQYSEHVLNFGLGLAVILMCFVIIVEYYRDKKIKAVYDEGYAEGRDAYPYYPLCPYNTFNLVQEWNRGCRAGHRSRDAHVTTDYGSLYG